jgi:hypothetical protein
MEQESPAAAGTAGPGSDQSRERANTSATPAQRQAKWRRVLAAFLERGLRGRNRFEAARELLGLSTPAASQSAPENALRRGGGGVQTLGSPTNDRKEVVPTHLTPLARSVQQ